jgi:predicted HTH domain antitoxin
MPPIVTPELLEPELRAVTRAGGYGSDKETIGHALETLLVANRSLRVDTAVALYRDGDVTLARAAEIAGVDSEGLKDVLAREGVARVVDEAPEDVRAGAERVKQWRSQ